MLKKVLVITAMCIGIFLCMLDTTVMNIALPAIQNGLNTNLSDLSWAINAYTIIFAAFTIPLSKVAERIGLHKFYILGLIFFLIGSIISASSQNLAQLIGGRAVQSLGAATIFPLSMVIGISTTSLSRRTRVIAALGVTQGLAAALGPTIGGILTQYFSWRWIFLVNAPLILISIILCLIYLDFKEAGKNIKIDFLGALLSIIMLFTLTLALVQGRDWGWRSPLILTLLIISLGSLTVFIIYERKIDSPMIPMKLFENRQFIGASLTIVLSNLFLVGVTVILPTFFTKIQGKSELTAALLVTPISAMIFICSPIAALMIKKIGARFIIAIGFLSMGTAYVLFTYISMTSIFQITGTCMLLGFGYGIITGPITVLAADDFTGEMLTASQSVAGVLRQVGIVLAVAIFVTGLYNNLSSAKETSLHNANSQVERMNLSSNLKIKILGQARKQIESENSTENFQESHITEQEKKNMIIENYNNELKGKDALSIDIKSEIKQEITNKVNSKINQINSKINQVIKKIIFYTKNQFSNAFISLYRNSIAFVLVSSIVSFLFKKKNESDGESREHASSTLKSYKKI